MTKTALHHRHSVLYIIKKHTMSNPVFSNAIEKTLGISGVTVREIVHYFRTEESLPICAESKGYFYPTDKTQALRTIKSLRSRAKQNNEAASGIEAHYSKDDQQLLF